MDSPVKLQGSDVTNAHTGERWVYSDIVKDHFFHPRNLLLDEPSPDVAAQFDARGTVGSPACIAPETTIVQRDGFTPIEDVPLDASVWSHDDQYHPVSRIYRPRSEKPLVTVKTQLGTLTCTDDHLIYAIPVDRSGRYPFVSLRAKQALPPQWLHAADLKRGDMVLYPRSRNVHDLVDVLLSQRTPQKWDFKSKVIPSMVPLNDETLGLFGYFIAEGHTKHDDSEIGFTFSDHEYDIALRIQNHLKKYFGLEATIIDNEKKHRVDVVCYSVHLAEAFRTLFGAGAVNKHIPQEWLHLALKKQEALLRGLWLGDGYLSDSRKYPRAGFVTISETLLHQVRFLLLRLGIVPSVYQEAEKTVRGVHHQRSYRIHVGDFDSVVRVAHLLRLTPPDPVGTRFKRECWFDETYVHVPVREVVRSIGQFERLYNFEVSVSHTYTTDAFLVHNCGDVMDMWIKVADDKIADCKWKTFGCGSAIAATSMFSVMVTENGGMHLDDALKVKPQDIMARLGGLPNRKIHCSVLADKAFRKAVNEYFRASGQHERIVVEGARVVDPRLNITDKDVEEAVLEGAQTLEEVQQKLKVGVGDPEAVPAIEQLIRFYKEKYYG